MHSFLGMTLDFSVKGECRVQQFGHVEDMIRDFPEETGTSVALTLASNYLYEEGGDLLLSTEKKEIFHRITAKGIFVSSRSWPDITPTVSVLSGRVREPVEDDWQKLKC